MLLSLYSDLCSFHHRATRLELWLVHIVLGIMNIAMTFLILYYLGIDKIINMLLLIASAGHDVSMLTDVSIIRVLFSVLIGFLYYILTFIPPIATTVRRLHDLNFSGWWLLLIWIVLGAVNCGVWYIAKHFALTEHQAMALLIGKAAVHIAYFIFLFCWPGTRGPNKYGSDAREIRAYIRKRLREVKEEKKRKKAAGAKNA